MRCAGRSARSAGMVTLRSATVVAPAVVAAVPRVAPHVVARRRYANTHCKDVEVTLSARRRQTDEGRHVCATPHVSFTHTRADARRTAQREWEDEVVPLVTCAPLDGLHMVNAIIGRGWKTGGSGEEIPKRTFLGLLVGTSGDGTRGGGGGGGAAKRIF